MRHNHRHQSHHKHFKNHRKPFTKEHPIATGVLLIIVSLILFRLSFTNSFLGSSEVFMWSIILNIGLFIAGLLVLIAWWRNHIATINTRHSVNWRNR